MARYIKRRNDDSVDLKMIVPNRLEFHALFGYTPLSNHLLYDQLWTSNFLIEQLDAIVDITYHDKLYQRRVNRMSRRVYVSDLKNFETVVKKGKFIYHMIRGANKTELLKNTFIVLEDLKRLYQILPLTSFAEYLYYRICMLHNQRNFYNYYISVLQLRYKNAMLQRAEIIGRIQYGDERLIEQDLRCSEFRKKIENSLVRLQAVRSINSAYAKIFKCIDYERIFYDAILGSLTKDIEDQTNFIQNIIFQGVPAIENLKVIITKYKVMETEFRLEAQEHIKILTMIKDDSIDKQESQKKMPIPRDETNEGTTITFKERETPKRNTCQYVRETPSMMTLKKELEKIEIVIKRVKNSTLSSRTNEIVSRIRSQSVDNYKLRRSIRLENMGLNVLNRKIKIAMDYEAELSHDLCPDETQRLKQMINIKNQITNTKYEEEDTIKDMKNRNRVFILLRVTLWNLLEIVRHIDGAPLTNILIRTPSYLELPLLKFDMFNIGSIPPPYFKENVSNLMELLRRKLELVTKTLPKSLAQSLIDENIEKYESIYLESLEHVESVHDGDEQKNDIALLQEIKGNTVIFNRNQLKLQSIKIVEENAKKEE